MPSWGGALGGAASGAELGSVFGPWGTAIGAGVGGLAGLFGLGGGGGTAKVGPTSPTFRRAEQIGDLSKEFAFDYALPQAKQAYGDVLPYYEGLLSGNRADIASKMQPELSTINAQYNQAAKNLGQFTPQGGGQTSQLSELPFQKIAAETTAINQARPQAAAALGSLAGQITGEGLQAGQIGLNAVADQLNALLGKASQDIPLQQEAGAGTYQILRQMMGQQDQGGGFSGDASINDQGLYPGETMPGGGGGGWDFGGYSGAP